MKRGWIWPVAVVALLGFAVAANLVLLFAAVGDPSFAVEPDYYRKAVAWDEVKARAVASRELGWTVDLAFEGDGSPGRPVTVVVNLHDREGHPVEGAAVAMETFHNARASRVLTAELDPRGGGTYAATLPLVRPGLWEFRIRAVLGEAMLIEILTRDVGWSQ